MLLSLSGALESHLIVIWWAALIMIGATLIALATSLNEKIFHLIHDRLLGRFDGHRIAQKLRQFHETYLSYRQHPGPLVTFSILTIAEQMVPVAALWLIGLALGIHLGLLALWSLSLFRFLFHVFRSGSMDWELMRHRLCFFSRLRAYLALRPLRSHSVDAF